MCQEINYIRAVIDNHDISLTWLAKKINKKFPGAGMTKQRISYIKESGKEISTTLYKQFRTIFDEYNFKVSDFDHIPEVSEMVSELNTESAKLVADTITDINDNILTDTERADLLLDIAHIEERTKRLRKLLEDKQ